MKVINKYRIMWVLVMFDLPTQTKEQRKHYALFRKGLMKDGFNMMQYSVYARHCPSRENADAHIRRVKIMLPPRGMISIMTITDKQFGDIKNFWGTKKKKAPKAPEQLEMF